MLINIFIIIETILTIIFSKVISTYLKKIDEELTDMETEIANLVKKLIRAML